MISLLKERRKDFVYPISATTRKEREWEIDWDTYYFLNNNDFEKWIKNWDFLEYALVHKKAYYWTLKKPILEAIEKWRIVIREIDVQWFDSILKSFPKNKLSSIFITPPSEEILRKRILDRAPISKEELDLRMLTMKEELKYLDIADIILEQWTIEWMYEDLIWKIESISPFNQD